MLDKWLARHDKTQQWLAAKLGVRQSHVSQWIAGMEPRASMAAAIHKITGISVAAWGDYENAAPTTRAV